MDATVFENINEVLVRWGEKITDAMGQALPIEKDVPNDRGLRDSIRFSLDMSGLPVIFQISLADYYMYVDQGRKPGGKFPPPDVIRQWIINKNLAVRSGESERTAKMVIGTKRKNAKDILIGEYKGESYQGLSMNMKQGQLLKSLTYLIGRKIAREGIEPTPFYTNTVTDAAIQELSNDLSIAFKQDILVQIVTR